MINPNIHIVHVGGRGGLGPLMKILEVAPQIVDLTVIEAFLEDEPMTTVDAKKLASYREINACIWSSEKEKEFIVTASPPASSLLPIAESSKEYIMARYGKLGLRWGDVCKPVRTIKVKTKPLDAINFHAPVDFLSMDIQGAELEALKGATNVLKNVVSLITECEYVPTYENQALFADQEVLLEKAGFKYLSTVTPGDWLANGIVKRVWCEVLWSRPANSLYLSDSIDKKELALKLIKLGIILFILDHKSVCREVSHLGEFLMKDEIYFWKNNSKIGSFFAEICKS